MSHFSTELLFLVAGINGLLGLFIILGQKKSLLNLVFSLFVMFAALWSAGLGFFLISSDVAQSTSITSVYYAAAGYIAVFFYLFAYFFTLESEKPSLKIGLRVLPGLLFFLLVSLNHNLVIQSVFFTSLGKEVVINQIGYIIFALVFVYYTTSAYYLLVKKYTTTNNLVLRKQLDFIIIGTILGFAPAMVFDLLLPFFGNYRDIWIGPLFSVFMFVSVFFAVTRHHLFNIKVIFTESITFLLWIFIITRTLLEDNLKDQLISLGLFVVTLLFGILLIRGVLNEVETREKIEKLAGELEIANEKLKSLDKLKTEFLSLASHQLRSPLTAIKGYTSMLLEGDFGAVNDNQKQAIDRVFQSSQNLTRVVEDLLDVSKIEQGGMQFQFANIDIKPLVESIASELSIGARTKGLEFAFTAPESGDFTVSADELKLRQVILNLIDNSVKYTKEGSIDVSVTENGNYVRITVKDTGMGMTEETKAQLFQKFNRGEGGKMNSGGSGLGLYLAKEIMLAHKGKIWVESDGPDKGSSFIVELRKANAPVPTV